MKLSVCLTTYNRAAQLDRTLASLAEQTRQPDELIVSDDCSPDRTSEVVARWQEVLPQLRYSRNEQNLYMPGNLNAALRIAGGEYIANLHDADEFEPTLLADWEAALDANPSAGFVFCGARFKGRPPAAPPRVYLHDVAPLTPGREFFERHLRHRFSSIVWGTVMARKTAYDLLLPFDPSFGFISDVDMWMRMSFHFDVAYVRKPLLVLDDSPTDERSFSWSRTETVQAMQRANLHRFYADAPARLAHELKVHAHATRSYYTRRILGRLRHGEIRSALEGMLRLTAMANDHLRPQSERP